MGEVTNILARQRMKLSHQFLCNTFARTTRAPCTTALYSPLWRRSYSIKPTSKAAELPGLDPAKLQITKTSTPKELTPNEELLFGKTFTGKLSYHSLYLILTVTLGGQEN